LQENLKAVFVSWSLSFDGSMGRGQTKVNGTKNPFRINEILDFCPFYGK